MPHRIEHLRETLRELEEELASLDELDAESRRLLQTAANEIDEALHKHEQEDEEDISPATWTGHLSELATQFEYSHPTLSRIVGNVANALAQLGI